MEGAIKSVVEVAFKLAVKGAVELAVDGATELASNGRCHPAAKRRHNPCKRCEDDRPQEGVTSVPREAPTSQSSAIIDAACDSCGIRIFSLLQSRASVSPRLRCGSIDVLNRDARRQSLPLRR